MRLNTDYWIAFANNLQLGVQEEDMMLVTGRDLTTSWAVAAFGEEARDVSFSLEVGFVGGAGSLASRLSWSSRHHVEHNWGPNPSDAYPHNSTSTSIQPAARLQSSYLSSFHKSLLPVGTSETSASPINSQYNQCVFLRAYRWKKRPLLPRRLRAAAGFEDFRPTRDEDQPLPLTAFQWSSSDDNELELVSEPDEKKVSLRFSTNYDLF